MELFIINNAPNGQDIPLFIKEDDGQTILNPQAEDEEDNLNILAVTWNMGASEDKNLLDGLDGIFQQRLNN